MQKTKKSENKALSYIKQSSSKIQGICSFQEQQINQFFNCLLAKKKALNCCLGCLTQISPSLTEITQNILNTQNIAIIDWQTFLNIPKFLQYLCAFMNSRGGYIFVCEQNKDQKGYMLSANKKLECQQHVGDCFNYIGPKTVQKQEVTQTEFVPILHIQQDGNKGHHGDVIRIRVDPSKYFKSLRNNQVCYLNYQGGSGGKNSSSSVYILDYKKQDVQRVEEIKVYELMHKRFTQKNIFTQLDRYHVGSECVKPLFVPTKIQSENINEAPSKEDFKKFQNSSYLYFGSKKQADFYMQKIKKILLQKQIIFKAVRAFQSSIKWPFEQHSDIWIIFHQQKTQAIKSFLTGEILNQVKLIKTSHILKNKLKISDQEMGSDLEKLKIAIKEKFKSSEDINNIVKKVSKNSEGNYILQFKGKIYALFSLCFFQAHGRRYELIQP